jgi:hypothetical protein
LVDLAEAAALAEGGAVEVVRLDPEAAGNVGGDVLPSLAISVAEIFE